jgi:tetratricopeptide (TPR) repeat protein
MMLTASVCISAPAQAQEAATAETATVQALLEDARRRALQGDYEGTRIGALRALEQPGPHDLQARYLLGMAWEYDGQLDRALAEYDQILASWPANPPKDVLYRRAVTLGKAKRYPDALRQLAALPSLGSLGEDDALKIALLKGLWSYERGQHRNGLKALGAALAEAGEGAPYHQSMVRYRLLDMAVEGASAIPFRGSKGKKAKQLQQRALHVQAARDQLVALIPLGQTEWTIRALHRVGDAHAELGTAMLDESAPRGLDGTQQTIYDREIWTRVEAVWLKASLFYDRALQVASRDGWTGEPIPALEQAYQQLNRSIEAGPPKQPAAEG